MPDRSPVPLIDADVLAWKAAACVEKTIRFETDTCLPVASLADARAAFDAKLAAVLRRLEAREYILCFSDDDPAANFRRILCPSYKINREGKPRPVVLSFLRRAILAETPPKRCCQRSGLEADDCLGILATRRSFLPDRRKIVVSIDKDLRGIPGLFHDLGHPESGVQTISPPQADLWFMTQTLTGDPVDGYPGCPKIGPQGAAKLLRDVEPTIDALWPVVLSAYQKAGLGPDYALTQARLARILRAEDYDFKHRIVKLWTPPTTTPVCPSSRSTS